jgi:hypothetical protein
VIRKGAIVSVPEKQGHWTTAQAYVDLRFADGHVERWRGAWNSSTDPGDLLAYGLAAAEDHEPIADYGMAWGDAPRDEFAAAPIEIVFESVPGRSDPSRL